MKEKDPYKPPETPAPEKPEKPAEKTVADVRKELKAADPESVNAFRNAIAARHAELDAALASDDLGRLPFLEQEFIRIQRDAVRAMLVAANLQAEVIAQTAEPAK